ncbi:SprT-like domain-containing protein [Eudoraea sp.]|uniref:SprT-like domain-containing protein n=1 Tax=Eudoraea sp. TaxID=1979955 RepID=UPI003C76206D
MSNVLQSYLPDQAVNSCLELIKLNGVHLKIVNKRVTRHGDYRRMPDGSHQITINASPNPYRFLITLVHEVAHLMAFEKYGRTIKPHGLEWKRTFQHLMLPFIRPEIFPNNLLPLVARHFKNPKASSSTDTQLALALNKYDLPSDLVPVFELPYGSIFRLYNGKLFKKGSRKVKRIECVELESGRRYLFQPHAEVELIKE